jgi:hypothetical protein
MKPRLLIFSKWPKPLFRVQSGPMRVIVFNPNISSPVFVTDEGYSFEVHVYPKGTSSYPNYISFYVYQGTNFRKFMKSEKKLSLIKSEEKRYLQSIFLGQKFRDKKECIRKLLIKVATDNDKSLVWPLLGKQMTVGIIEQGKPIEQRVVMRKSFTVKDFAFNSRQIPFH